MPDNVKLAYESNGAEYNSSLFSEAILFILLFNNLVSISLIITIDVVRVIQALLMERDEQMMKVKEDVVTRTQARSSNMNETLGMVR